MTVWRDRDWADRAPEIRNRALGPNVLYAINRDISRDKRTLS
jgi:hypothetical protein